MADNSFNGLQNCSSPEAIRRENIANGRANSEKSTERGKVS
ncbi:uncharacterized protein N7458_012665 [Penicillium daleae]|uniref:Uncharacterized protein n=1 Tax=Penicillium daleae TaxID=63821 RepID=A0AAD6BXH3_9EURO|nr:uncharacterized protein N7458_012665 [Penicillium daleae]KAJ5433509.1 hypothetical protein N7458_012665 [Penicillium daleae]